MRRTAARRPRGGARTRRARARAGAGGPDLPQPPRQRPRDLQRGRLRPAGRPDRRRHLGLAGGGAHPGRRRRAHHRRPPGRPEGPGGLEGDRGRRRPPLGPGRRNPVPARCGRFSAAALRRRTGHGRCLARRGGERGGQDHHHRQVGPAGDGRGPFGAPGRRGHLPCRCGRPVGDVGRALRGGDRAGRRGGRPQCHRLRRRAAGGGPGQRSRPGRHGRTVAQQGQPGRGAQEDPPHRRPRPGQRDRGPAGPRRHHRAERPRPGEGVHRSGRRHRDRADQAGRHGEGRHRHRGPDASWGSR